MQWIKLAPVVSFMNVTHEKPGQCEGIDRAKGGVCGGTKGGSVLRAVPWGRGNAGQIPCRVIAAGKTAGILLQPGHG
ncbi:hypothetical protein MACH01_12200 [Thalassospira tepidiphila]|nr:hypothetical protein MACH01_12200 [Thalassospira tepidiphila]